MPPPHLIMINSVYTEPANNITFIYKPTKNDEIRDALDTCFRKTRVKTDFIIYLRSHGARSSSLIGFDTIDSSSKLFIIDAEELSAPIIKARSDGHVVLGVIQMCYGGNNTLLTESFDMVIGPVGCWVAVSPIHSEKIVVDFINNVTVKGKSISKTFTSQLYPDYCKLGNKLADAWGDSSNNESVWKLYENK